jgi:hypothetical protein
MHMWLGKAAVSTWKLKAIGTQHLEDLDAEYIGELIRLHLILK